jgi:predicted nicotinamide N-methyase
LREVAGLPGIRIHTADDVTLLWHATGMELGLDDPPLPYWGFAWPGGLALAHHLVAYPELVAGRRVLDLGAGSGLCGIVARRTGAAAVTGVDVDPIARAAAALNARANEVELTISGRDVLADPPAGIDVVLAGDVSYEESMAARIHAWLRSAADAGLLVLIGDPGRAYLPPGLVRVASYEIESSREIEDGTRKPAFVLSLPSAVAGTPRASPTSASAAARSED